MGRYCDRRNWSERGRGGIGNEKSLSLSAMLGGHAWLMHTKPQVELQGLELIILLFPLFMLELLAQRANLRHQGLDPA